MKQLLRKILIDKVEDLLKISTEQKAYSEYIKYLNCTPEFKDNFTDGELESFFPKPAAYDINSELETNEIGDQFIASEFTDGSNIYKLSDFPFNNTWLKDKVDRNKIYNNPFYQNVVRLNIGDMPEEVKADIELHSTHILGRCNNPNDWKENKQGLVFGMVQSGKTVSMLTLIGQARAVGYRIFIVLAGEKNSLREQTQKRINECFGLNVGGYSKNHDIRSLTTKGSDYSNVSQNIGNGLNLWSINDNTQTYIICIKKQTDNLNKLIEHLKEIETSSSPGGSLAHIVNYDTDFKTMIIDDEADNASQDARPDNGGTTIHNDITALRNQLKQNCYVAYTATPQACIGANPEKSVGYPSDFVWLLEPHRDITGETSTYLGLEEFFEKYPNQLINRLPKETWPRLVKEDKKNSGVYNPITGEVNKAKLTEKELNFITEIIKNKITRDKHCSSFKVAIVDYLVGCSIRWYKHYIKLKNEGFFNSLPTINDIEEIEVSGLKKTKNGFKPFPYHAMMFNLSYITDTQKKIREFVELLWPEIKAEWVKTEKNSWSIPTLFTIALENQNKKSYFFGRSVVESNDIQHFLKAAIEISSKNIVDDQSFIYLLNSKDEGTTLQYDNQLAEKRPKKASIIVGGNVLSRGLTIENLSVTVFARSQVMSLGDTNLQMCRWFGHKRNDIDLQSVYLQEHSQILFQEISQSDKELRQQFRTHIFNDVPNECLLLSLFSSPLFRSTSPTKSKFLEKVDASYSGINKDMLEPFRDKNYESNNGLLDSYLKQLPPTVLIEKHKFERANLYYDVPIDPFIEFFKSLNFDDNAMNITPKQFISYFEKWREEPTKPIPGINIAVFDVDSKGIGANRRRQIVGSIKDFKTKEELKENASDSRLAPFRGGKSDANAVKKNPDKSYCGDVFIDMPLSFHKDNYDKKNLRRDRSMKILIIFYKLNANYVGLFPQKKEPGSEPVFFEKDIDNQKYRDTKSPVITFSVAMPLGGPVFRTEKNKKVVSNTKTCEDFFDKLYGI